MPGTFNIADLFEGIAAAMPERTALVSGSRRMSFAALDARADRVAEVLRGRGVGPGAHVGLHLYNGKSSQFQIFNNSEQQIGFGLWYDY